MSQISMTLTPEIISGYIVEKCAALGIHDTSQMKLQKLVFFAWVWYGVLYKKKLFDEKPVAWEHGPLFQSLRKQTKDSKYNPITTEDLRYGKEDIKDKVLLKYLDNVIANYGKYSAYELSYTSVRHYEVVALNSRHHEGAVATVVIQRLPRILRMLAMTR